MSDRVKMTHRSQDGQANVLPENVAIWAAKGWQQVTPARGKASAKQRAKQDAIEKGQNND